MGIRYAAAGETALIWITLTTLWLFFAGFVLAGVSWARRGGPVFALALLFGLGVLLQSARLLAGVSGEPALDLATAGALTELGIALAALFALLSTHRTTRERDRAEDLHWDSMEAVRALTELSGQPGVDFDAKLDRMLTLGAQRFRMELGGAWETGPGDADGRWLQLLGSEGPLPEAQRERFEHAIVRASQNAKPLYLVEEGDVPFVFFGTAVRVDGEVRGALGFAGERAVRVRFAATENDILTLMAQWLASEIEHRDTLRRRAAAPRPAPARLASDLNAQVEQCQARLQRLVGADATLEVELHEPSPVPRSRTLAPARLLESLVSAALRAAPTGRIQIATGRRASRDADDASDATLTVSAHSSAIDASAFDRLFSEDIAEEAGVQPLALGRVERVLRSDGGDLSVSVEPGHGVSLVAFLPTQPGVSASLAAPVVDQPSR